MSPAILERLRVALLWYGRSIHNSADAVAHLYRK